jgi:hypothetical protein
MNANDLERGWLGRILAFAPPVLAAVVGVAVWEVFRPGLLDGDGVTQMAMATGQSALSDWYPPLLALSMVWALRTGGGLSALTLLQAVAGSTGVYWMAAEVLRFITRGRRPDGEMRWGGLAVLVLLLNPFCFLMYYLVHYRNDSLAVVFLTWAVAGWLCVARVWDDALGHVPLGRKLFTLLVAAVASIMVVVVRYNAVVMLPVFLLFLALTVGRASRSAAALTAVALIVGPIAVHEGSVRLSGATPSHPVQQIMGAELVGMCVEREDLRATLPYTTSFLIEDRYRTRYIPGNASQLFEWFYEPLRIARKGYMHGDFAQLSGEYRRAIRTAPGTWLTVKFKAAAASLMDQEPFWHYTTIDPNPWGIAFRDDLRFIRSSLLAIDRGIRDDPFLRSLCDRHLQWFVLNVVFIILAGIAAGLTRTRGSILLLALLLFPMAYYVSHLVAVASHDYRYMYPGTLLVQILFACGALERAVRWVHAQILAQKYEEFQDRLVVVPKNGDGSMVVRPATHPAVEPPGTTTLVTSRCVG